ncbi:MAG: hypothetical protein K2K72_05225, partial [Duncaniella sp.]|nr:hypothetical protein [Duncaniella sp.]
SPPAPRQGSSINNTRTIYNNRCNISVKSLTHNLYLTAAEVNAQEEMSLSSLAILVIDVATAHANSLGVGYAHMMETNSSWVLSRLNADIAVMPTVNRHYRMITWVHSLNRIFSDRLFRLEDAETGELCAWIHTTWMAIDMDTRRPTDLTRHQALAEVVSEREFGGTSGSKLPPMAADRGQGYEYTFKYSDIDVNRHVTTRRYIDLIVDLWPLEMYERNRVKRFEIAFKHEIRYGSTASVVSAPALTEGASDEEIHDAELRVDDTACAIARVTFSPRR